MEGCLYRGWGLILHGCGGTGVSNEKTWLYPPRVVLALRPPADKRSASGIGVSTPCGAVSTRENSIFVSGLSEL